MAAPVINDFINSEKAVEFFAENFNLIVGNINDALYSSTPYVDILGEATWGHNLSEVKRKVMQGEAAYAHSLINPQFIDAHSNCGTPDVPREEMGKVEFQYTFSVLPLSGGTVCMNIARDAFKGSINTAVNSLKNDIIQYKNSDIRWNMLSLSGLKASCIAGVSFESTISGGNSEYAISAQDPTTTGKTPNATLTYNYLKRIATRLRNDLKAESIGQLFAGRTLRFIGSQEILDKLRNEANVGQVGIGNRLNYLAAGGDKEAQKEIRNYHWSLDFYDIEAGVDPMVLRFNIGAAGQIEYVEPRIAVAGATGDRYSVVNPDWQHAIGEIAMLVADRTLIYMTSSQNLSEGLVTFNSVPLGGEVSWFVSQGQDNKYRNKGELIAQLGRAYEPQYPGHIAVIYYLRCSQATDLLACSTNSL